MKKKILLIVIFLIVLVALLGCIYAFGKISIKLNGGDNIEALLNGEYKEQGATARFLFWKIKNIKIDGEADISKMGTYKIKYSASFLGKKASKERTVVVKDGIEPELILKGKDNIKLYVNGSYTEAGYTATDNIDGDITDKVIVKNEINLEEVGKYKGKNY